MLTIFSCPKPFKGHINIIQRNAIRSWSLLQPMPEIILLGNEDGTEEICKEFGLRYISDIERNEYGTPLVNSIFKKAEKIAKYPILCYINADIILLKDFIPAIRTTHKYLSQCLIIGRRWDLNITNLINFSDGWQKELKNSVLKNGNLHAPTGIDYFVFTKGLFQNIPPFALGRTMWDNWLVYYCAVIRRAPVVDISSITMVIHQNHDYSHQKWKDPWRNVESRKNFKLAGGSHLYEFYISNATYKIKPELVRLNLFSLYYIKFINYCNHFPLLFPIVRIIGWIRYIYWMLFLKFSRILKIFKYHVL